MNNRIKELREERNMTRVRLAMELEVSQETISAYEIGKHFPGIPALLKLADLFNTSLDYIMGISDIRKPTDEKLLPNDETQLLTLYRKLRTCSHR